MSIETREDMRAHLMFQLRKKRGAGGAAVDRGGGRQPLERVQALQCLAAGVQLLETRNVAEGFFDLERLELRARGEAK